MYMKRKPVKFGHKLWIHSSFDGCLFHIIPNQEHKKRGSILNMILGVVNNKAKKMKNKSLSETVVENLLPVIEVPHKAQNMDNFFTSYDLFVYLRNKQFLATGKVSENRMEK